MRRIVVAGTLLLLSGCAAFHGDRPQIEKRFASQVDAHDDAPATIRLTVTSAETQGSSDSIAITQLGDRAQAALIEQTKGKPPIALKAEADAGGATVVRNTIDRRLVVSILPEGFLPPGDRIDAIQVALAVAPAQAGHWRITGWSQASNGSKTVDVGTLTSVNESKISASTGLALGALLPSATVGAEAGRSDTRVVDIKDSTDFDAGVDAGGRAWLYESAGWRQSLAHNLSVDTTVTAPREQLSPVPVVSFSSLVAADGSGRPARPGDVRLTAANIFVPLAYDKEPVCGHATLSYRVRHITNPEARATFTESDDIVRFVTRIAEADFLLAPAPYQPLYVIRVDGNVVHFAPANAEPRVLALATIEEAIAFRDWYRAANPAGGRVGDPQAGASSIGVLVSGSLRPLAVEELRRMIPGVSNPQAVLAAADADVSSCHAAAR